MVSEFFLGILLLIIGFLIRLQKATFLIAGFNTLKDQEKEKLNLQKLTKFIGNILFIIAGLHFIAATLLFFQINNFRLHLAALQIFFIIFSIIYANTGNRFKQFN